MDVLKKALHHAKRTDGIFYGHFQKGKRREHDVVEGNLFGRHKCRKIIVCTVSVGDFFSSLILREYFCSEAAQECDF